MARRSLVFVIVILFYAGVSCALHCIHDEIAPSTFNPPQQRGVVHSKGKRAAPGQFIRIQVDTSALLNDPDRLCTTTGQWAKTGFPGGSANNPIPVCNVDCTSCNCWFQCTDQDVLTAEKLAFLNNTVFPDVKEYFQSALNLDRVVGNLVLSQSTCGCFNTSGVPISSSYQTGVANTDFVIFLTARTTRFNRNVIAFACPCVDDSTTKRPLAGYINWGPNSISLDPQRYREQLGVGIHEITHALGFTTSKYQYYGGNTGGGGSPTISRSVTESGVSGSHSITLMATPKVIEVAQKHFNCSSIDGVELENGGSSGTASSHWERRVLYNEYMTGYSSYDPVYSEFTLALLEDSGWYYPNYTAARDFPFGRNMGCNFVNRRCNNRSFPYFSSNSNDEGCAWDGIKKGRSNLVQFNGDLDEWYQYFSDPTMGGRDDLADYCPFLTYSVQYRGDCTVSEYNTPGDVYYNVFPYGQVYCPTCRCMSANAADGASGGSCHNISCSNGQMRVKIGYIWYECESSGQRLQITSGYDGSYTCPDMSVCNKLPQDNAPWPKFIGVTPTKGKLGTQIKVTASGFGSNPLVLIGIYHGCSDLTIQGNEITCSIGAREGAPLLRGDNKLDVVIVDQDTGHTDFAEGAFTFSIATMASPFLYLIFTFTFVVFFAL